MSGSKSTRDIGSAYETIACNYLQSLGFHLIDRNYHCKMGEIDLIMKHKGFHVFIEVRYRKQKHYGEPIATVSKSKQRKIIKTALFYLLEHELYDVAPCRFDVVAIEGNNQIEWIESAFDASK